MAQQYIAAPCEKGDMYRCAQIWFDAMQRDHPILDVTWPAHWTPAGVDHGAARLEKELEVAEKQWTKHIKIMDNLAPNRPIVGYGRWVAKPADVEGPPAGDAKLPVDGELWPVGYDEERRYGEWLLGEFVGPRNGFMKGVGVGKEAWIIDMLSVDPAVQRGGVGSAFVKWGLEQIDQKGAWAGVEAAITAEKFYGKHGFVSEKHYRYRVPNEKQGVWGKFGEQEFIWMVRKPVQ